MKIYCETTDEVADICARFVRAGVTFLASKGAGGMWIIELTGGF